MKELTESMKIGAIHIDKIQYAKNYLQHYFPISTETVSSLKISDIAMFELFTNRFSKLQDLMGNKIFSLVLTTAGEPADEMTFIDKINKLEKLKIIDSAQEWMILRQIRNHLSHEYPDHPELTAQFLNQAYEHTDKIISLFEKINHYVNSLHEE